MTTNHGAWQGARRVFLSGAALALAVAFATPIALGQDGAGVAEEPLPSAESIIERMIAAEGGREALTRIRTLTIHGELEIASMGIKAKFTSWNAGPGKYRESISLGETGELEQGRLGEVAWMNNPIQGGRLLEGIEKDMMRRSSHIHPLLYIEEDYAAMACVGRKEIRGEKCFELAMTPRTGQPETWFVREADLVIVRSEMPYEGPQGKLKISMDCFDYRELNGLRLPHRMELEQGPQELNLTIQEYVHNAEIPAEKFALPEAVQALVDKQGAAGGTGPGGTAEPGEGAKPPEGEKPAEKPPVKPPEKPAEKPAPPGSEE
jgi:hypothetical protein